VEGAHERAATHLLVCAEPLCRGHRTAQPTEPLQADKSGEEIQAIKQRAADWLTTCLGDWDAQTHMTKSEWQITCKRVSKEREQFLLKTPGATSIGTKAAQ